MAKDDKLPQQAGKLRLVLFLEAIYSADIFANRVTVSPHAVNAVGCVTGAIARASHAAELVLYQPLQYIFSDMV